MASVSRRSVLQGAGVAAAATTMATGPTSPALAVTKKRVAILGAGMAGLSAAHELAQRGFEVTVYERNSIGGKARSIPVKGTAAGGRRDLPGEHGFRFFPGFYTHIPETMSRIPFGTNKNGVADNLVGAGIPLFPRSGGRNDQNLFGLIPDPRDLATPDALKRLIVDELVGGSMIKPTDAAYFATRLIVFLSSCDERRFGQWESTSWWDFVRAAKRNSEYQTVAARGLTRALVAAKEEIASTRTIGNMAEAFLYSFAGLGTNGRSADEILNGPTNEVWIDPWVDHLEGLGVRFQTATTITGLTISRGKIVAARATTPAGPTTIDADWFVSAMPVERFTKLLTPALVRADPSFAGLRNLVTDWMNGIQFYLKRPAQITDGHLAFMDSPWSLTGILQGSHWTNNFAETYGDGAAVDCLSVDISDWTVPGILYGKPAKECTRAEVMAETWAQMKAALEDTGKSVLPDDILHSWHLDPGIKWDPVRRANTNDEPLLINTVNSWELRPTARTKIPNLFLAGDYCRTNIDLATMEGANESGRQAANAILAESGVGGTPAPIFTMYRPPEWEALKAADKLLYKAGLKNVFDIG
ncbi:FAD-dependent oxidoreductase [Nocardioides humilatus]|uniref:FAD-dependent oxidoreductase n=1 Tax=Nocardioides humilatus TaxID=2607660 RepID=A0A5B1LNW0_9ACTN|nr:FAD-dependent oxidoreductase [Nocardioides humilatus]KAA1421287.1 FAD-dependent oxidoreductase [Nocardioides humilatus]